MKKRTMLSIAAAVAAIGLILLWLMLIMPKPEQGSRHGISPAIYALDNGIEVWRWDAKGPGKDKSKLPVVVVHGGGADASQWTKVAPKLAESGRTVFAFSWFNHGNSKKLPDGVFARRSILDISRVELAAVANHVLDTMPQYKQFDLIGRSMGGLASLHFAATNPAVVRHLAVMSPVVPAEFGGEVIPIPVTPFQPSEPGDAAQQHELFEPTTPADISQQHWLQSNPESPVAIWEATRWTAEVNVRDIKAKTLVITADPELDRITPPAEIIKMAEAMGAAHHTVKGVGHSEMMYFDPHWRNISKMLVDFLNQN